ncbi:eCIS core domain-containing protein [Streptomyces griseus]|uniref:eCIS core domain-containing protein n=1 Tax=Streptomyces griseus TaxID=1911 RepID=UPI0033CFA601
MRAQGNAGRPESERTDRTPGRTPATVAAGADGAQPAGLQPLQGSVGNAAVVQMLRRAGHTGVQTAEQERHQHGPDCDHQQAETPAVQRAAAPQVQRRSAVHDVLRTGGRPLDDSTRTDMESRLGADFSDVRIHNDRAAKASAAEVGARAYTSGSHIVIGDGGADKHTLAHELTHVIQQRQGPVAGTDNGSGLKVSDPSDRFEREAEANASRVMSSAAPVLQRRPADAPGRAAAAPVVQRMPKAKKASPEARANKEFARAVKSQFEAKGWIADGSPEVWARMTLHKIGGMDAQQAAAFKSSNAAYKATPDNTMGPRSYAGEPDKQAMRWVSTVVKNYLTEKGENPIEIQAAIHGEKLYIAGNTTAANSLLASELGGLSGSAFLKKVLKEYPADSDDLLRGDAEGRLARHSDKTDKRIANDSADEAVTEKYANVITALAEPVTVASGGDEGYHAERRIVDHLTGDEPEKVIPDSLAGTKRPCVSCYANLFIGTEARPGPLWISGAANIGMAGYSAKNATRFVSRVDDAIGNTYATLQWECDADHEITIATTGGSPKTTIDYGTDSDSDTDGNRRRLTEAMETE